MADPSPVQFEFKLARSERTGNLNLVFAMLAGTEELGLVYAPADGIEPALLNLLDAIDHLGDVEANVKPIALKDWSEKVRLKRFGTRENLRLGVNFGNVGGAAAAVRQEYGALASVLGALHGAIGGLLRRAALEQPPLPWYAAVQARHTKQA